MFVSRTSRAFAIAMLCSCSCARNNGVPPQVAKEEPARPHDPFGSKLRVGNQAAGIDEQPDYDREALATREAVEGRLPDPLPSPKAACVAMYDAAIASYARTEGSSSPPVRVLEKTKREGLASCEAETSPAAASCVAVLAASDGGEFPWLLDQCSRAFP